ncbi:response regulator [Telluribacter humicola]|uniref:response regulator n=1 Tax=Telluribacter humicola TaxID=1720261 RepID=UPI001A96D594|nr:response regulator [Telluribacter humicola]
MKSALIPSDEPERLKVLQEYNILDTLPEKDFDDITLIASEICGTPISLISLVDEERQWFKSAHGLNASETHRDYAFCAHAILNPQEILEIPDTLSDDRFFDNPFTTGDPYVRFYAGAPLTTSEGHALGTLCVIDQKPKELTEKQRLSLLALANQVMHQLELRKKAEELEIIKKQLEATNLEMMEAKLKAEQASKAKSDFLSVMSHEIRNPLHSIVGYTNLLIEETPRADQQPPLKALRFSAETLLSLVNDILDLGKLEASKVELESIPFNLVELVNNVVQSNLHRASKRGNHIEIVSDPTLPTCLLGDPTRLLQILNNLVSNSIKFTEKGLIQIKLITVPDDTSDQITVHFQIADTGIGMSSEVLAVIFNEYTQASAEITRNYGGTGLGLSITQKLLSLFDSSIRVNSEVGKGSTFTFEIAFRKARGKVAVDEEQQDYDFSGFKVMVVDDSELNLKLIAHSLGRKGIRYELFSSPLKALEAARESRYDLILMDLQMPGMSGFVLSTEIRKLDEEVPIVALSADHSPETARLTREVGMNGYLPKPYAVRQLYQVMSQYLIKAKVENV